MQFGVLQNELGGPDGIRRYPVTSLEFSRRKLYCGVGGYVAVIDPKRGHTERLVSVGGESNKIVNKLAIRKFIWVSSKDSSVIRCLDLLSCSLRGSFDCRKVLAERHPDIDPRDCRVLTMYHSSDALWIGCGGGHIIIIEPTPNFKVLAVIKRYSSAVRSIIGACCDVGGKQVSMVLTGGTGFLERSPNLAHEENTCGCVLVWEAELPNQWAYLDQLVKTRREFYKS